MKTISVLTVLIVIAFLLSFLSSMIAWASAEKGEWIEYPFSYPSVGSVYAVCGEDCVGVTRAQSTSILFFDIYKSAWTELEFGTQHTVHDVIAEGHTVFAFTDEFLIAYSALTSNYDVIQYVGALLESGLDPSYGCGNSLAFFVTNETMYVFDAELGSWQEYNYILPANYSHPDYVVEDDYVWVVLYRGSGEQPKNIVYSIHTHSFNQLDNGCSFVGAVLDHGFARSEPLRNNDCLLIGYSAYANEFDVVQVNDLGYALSIGGVKGVLKADEITAYAACFRQVIEPGILVRADFYGYDTRLGSWSHVTVDFNTQEERYDVCWNRGGQFLVDYSIEEVSGIFNFIMYSGITGQWLTASPGIAYNSLGLGGTNCGGEVFLARDDAAAWAYSFTAEEGSMISLDKPNTCNVVCGDDFCVFNRYSTESSIMTMYIYNSETNNWTTIDLPKLISSYGYSNSEHIFVYNSYESPNRETVFYSSFLDTYIMREFPVNSSVWQSIGYTLAWASSDEKSYLFDAETGVLHEFNFEFVQNGLGDFSASFFNVETKTLYGYSTLSRQWTNLTIEDTPYTCLNKGFIGLVSSNIGTQYYKKYYAFNGLKDSWVELIPTGSYKHHRVGQKTALVIRSNMLYAFDPDGRTHTYEYTIEVNGYAFPVSIVSNSTISNFTFNQSLKEISFNVTGKSGTLGFCNITFPTQLLGGPYTVQINGLPVTAIETSNATHTSLYFTYTHSLHMVEIIGTTVIPEFSSIISTTLILAILTLTLLFIKRKPSRIN